MKFKMRLISPTKSVISRLIILLALAFSLTWVGRGLAQTTSSPVRPARVKPELKDLKVTERGANHRVWESIINETGPRGESRPVKHSYTELATGMHYQQNGQWLEANPEIVIQQNGQGLGQKAQQSAQFAANLKTTGAIDLTTPSGIQLRSHVLAIYYHDWKSQQSAQIGILQDSIGTIVGKNELIYDNAFAGLKADVRYRFKKSGMSQDIIFQEQLVSPADYNLDPDTTEIEVWTEFLNPPEPTKQSNEDKVTKQENISVLDFGDMQIRQGTAFMGSAGVPPAGVGVLPNLGQGGKSNIQLPHGTPVNKKWITLQGRTFLIESIGYKSILSQLEKLPARLQARNLNLKTKNSQLAHGRIAPPMLEAQTEISEKLKVAVLDHKEQGFVLDY
ncbi:MAG: hypothetical protein ACR2H1_12020, partial [Limisphaerales bacterium]